MTDPFFSVIIPTCDRPGDLAEALESLADQTFTDFEAVVVNDGAADVADVVAGSGLDRVRLLRTSGRLGPSGARNAGLAEARGRVIAYLDDDDWFRPGHLAMHAGCYGADPALRVVYSDAERVLVGEAGETADVPYSRDFDADALLVENYIPIICLSHHRACLDETGVFEPSLVYLEDWDLFIRLALRWPFRHVAEVTAVFREREAGGNVRQRHADRFVQGLNAVYARSGEWLARDPERLARVNDLRLARVGEMTFETGRGMELAGDLPGAARAYALAARHELRPEYCLARARVLRAMGDRAGALEAMQQAELCRAVSGGGRGL